MGTSLTGLTPATTYDALIKVGDNGPLSATAKVLSDGLGNDSPLAMSTTNVGIGTTTPVTKLQVSDSNGVVETLTSSSFFSGIDLENTGGAVPAKWNIQSVSGAQVGGTAGASFGIYNYNASAYRMFIDGSGNVGIGTSTPVCKLDVGGDSAQIAINRSSGNQPKLSFNANGSEYSSIISNASSGENRFSIGPTVAWGGFHTFYTDTTEKMRIGPTGNVGIGTTTPGSTLDVNGIVRVASYLEGGSFPYSLVAGSGADATITTLRGGSTAGQACSVVVSGGSAATNPNSIVFNVAAAERGRWTTNGLTFNGDTAAANALDDYEEGTFTATLTPSTSGTITLSSNTCTYTKIGRQVSVKGFLAVGSVSSPTGSVVIMGGLPFTTLNANSARGAGSTSYFPTIGAGSLLVNYQLSNSTEFNFVLTASTVTAGDEFYFTLTYFA